MQSSVLTIFTIVNADEGNRLPKMELFYAKKKKRKEKDNVLVNTIPTNTLPWTLRVCWPTHGEPPRWELCSSAAQID